MSRGIVYLFHQLLRVTLPGMNGDYVWCFRLPPSPQCLLITGRHGFLAFLFWQKLSDSGVCNEYGT